VAEGIRKRALILGVSGQDGAYLARLLLEAGYAVHGTSRDAESNHFANLRHLGIRDRVTLHSTTPTDFRSVVDAVSRVEPDEIYNLSGESSVALSFAQPASTFESVVVGTLNLLEAVRLVSPRIRFYNAASSESFGDTGAGGADEGTPFRPRSPYGVAKAAAFWTVANYREAYGLHACSGILFNHESPLRHARFVTRKVVGAAARIALDRGREIRLGDIGIRRDWGWAPEYVDAIWRILQQEAAGDYVIATGETHTLEEFVAAAFAQFGLDWQKWVSLDGSLKRPADIARSRGNPERAARLLGWRARTTMRGVVEKMARAERALVEGAADWAHCE
jgi:GDPmannose 4,6-dehydratase